MDLSELIDKYFLVLMDIPLEESNKRLFLSAIKNKDKKNVELWYADVLKSAMIGGNHEACRMHFNRMRFYINQEIGTNFEFVGDSEFA
jgi:hypothetical protein